jgi:CYTH domain-containing protein
MKYAVVERERRFLPVEAVDLASASRVIQIEDRYLDGTRLRLRTVREPGKAVVWKLGQKVRFAPGNPSAVAHTTMYLDEPEHTLLANLPAVALNKTRHVIRQIDGTEVAVDVFAGTLSGLTLTEIDLGTDGLISQPVPAWLGLEVTEVEAFTGYALACLEPGRLASLLTMYGSY